MLSHNAIPSWQPESISGILKAMNPLLNRRRFLKNSTTVAGLASLIGPGNCRIVSGQSASTIEWRFSLLGDLHFDHLDHHDFDWVKREHPGSVKQIENYSHITESNLPGLMGRVKKTISTQGCSSVVQIGDLVQGLCGNGKLARTHCEAAIDYFESLKLGVPVRVTKGNHDITGPGAVEAYNELVVPWVADGFDDMAFHDAHFLYKKGEDLFVYFDAYDPASFDWFISLMEERPADSTGRVFFIVHPPVVPYNARSSWCLYGKEHHRDKRERLYEILGKHQAIVLCGHLHKYALVERETNEGSFTQLSVSSVANRIGGKARDLISGVEQFGPDLVDLEPDHSPDTVKERRAILSREKPFIRRFDYGAFWGHAVIKVTQEKVEADIYHQLDEEPWKTVRLA
ncbi:MAG: metallophosphoesterase [Verrucomicrobiales bacterium]|nr:metallophosphoesterase [Verrucomicrobiales bacterium]